MGFISESVLTFSRCSKHVSSMNAEREEGMRWQNGFAAYQDEVLGWFDQYRNTQWQQHLG